MSARVLRWAGAALAGTALASALLFGLYILAFYAGAFADGRLAVWNDQLPRLYERATPAATAGIGLHFAAGGVLLVLGGVQLVAPLRRRFPAVHRWAGRVYVAAALLAGAGGLTFIAVKGTVGGPVMDAGFALYGVLTIAASVQTVRHARARRLPEHRVWALRLFALVIGSWLYRMEYGVWLMVTDGAGHQKDFHGPFDAVMAFWFYVPNLLAADAFSRARRRATPPALRLATAGVLTAATGLLVLGTYYFTKLYWGPAILGRLGG
ncbi:hypothetical protein tb265_02160 [Gemmatimonadetes bacterium T265]|nr:hypothetical protein tb265_02160 [Gemmatimonadetes bacterium T265]